MMLWFQIYFHCITPFCNTKMFLKVFFFLLKSYENIGYIFYKQMKKKKDRHQTDLELKNKFLWFPLTSFAIYLIQQISN